MIVSHKSKEYIDTIRKYHVLVAYNGAYFYSKELVENIIPYIKTDYNWVTINCHKAYDHSIVFIHNNNDPHLYDWLKDYKDIILVVSQKSTRRKVKHISDKIIYLPLSIDVSYVSRFKRKNKPFDLAFVGRKSKRMYSTVKFNEKCDYLEGMERDRLLNKIAQYRRVYAVGRCALEAKVLGCEVLPYDSRYPDPEIWKVLDNSEVIPMLQKAINRIVKRENKLNVTDVDKSE